MASSSSTSANIIDSEKSSNTSRTTFTVLHHLITIQLIRDNYLLWKVQVVPYLNGQHLYGFVYSLNPHPPQVIPIQSNGEINVIPNTAFTKMASTGSQNILAHVVKCVTS